MSYGNVIEPNNNTSLYYPTGTPIPTNTNLNILGNLSVAGNIAGAKTLSIAGNITGLANLAISNAITTSTLTAANTITGLGQLNISGNISANSNISAAGNITGAYFFGNAAFMTGFPAVYGNANVAAFLPTYTGNLNPSTVRPGNIFTNNYFFANGQPFTSGTTYTNANVAAYLPVNTANVQANNFTTTGAFGTGNIVGANYVQASFFVGDGSALINLPVLNYSNANVAGFLPVNTANVRANFFIGNGSQLTGLPATYSNANVATFLASSNVTISTTGNITANNMVTTSLDTTLLDVNNLLTVGTLRSDDYQYANGVPIVFGGGGGNTNYSNANVAAYLPINSANVAGNYFIGNGAFLTGVVTSSYGNANVAAYLPINTSNVAGNFFIGDGSQLTNLPAGNYSNANVANFLPTFSGNVQAGNIVTVGPAGNITGSNFVIANAFVGLGANLDLTTLNGHVIPNSNNTFTLGNTTNRWNAAFVAGTVTGGLFVGDGGGLSNVGGGGSNYGNANVVSLLANYGNNIINTTSTVQAANFVGDGSLLTNLPAQPSTYGNANVAAYLPTDSTIIAIQGNVTTLQGQVYGNANVASYLPVNTANVSANYFIGNGSLLTAITGANVTGTVATANTVTNPAQPSITSLGTLTGLSTGTLTTTGQFTANANAQFNGNVFFAGNVTLPGNINQISGNSGQFFGNASTGFGALYAGLPTGFATLAQEIMGYATNFNGYTQINLENTSAGDQATGDFVITADNGTDTTNFVNLGMTGSGYNGQLANNSLGNSVFATDGYLYAQGSAGVGGNLVIGSNTINGVTRFIANGKSSLNQVVATISSTGVSVNGNVTAGFILGNGSLLTNIPAGSPVIGTVTTAATITPAATDTQYNVTALAQSTTFAAPTGIPVDGAKLVIRILDNGTAQTLAWNATYQVVGTVQLPTTTVASQYAYVGCIYNSQASAWNVVSVA